MRIILITNEEELAKAAKEAYQATDKLELYAEWPKALDNARGADLMIVDLISTLEQPHLIAGYEKFATSKMSREDSKDIPLVLISPPDDYELDSMVGWPNFVFGMVKRPVTMKIFRRISTWI